MPKSSIAFLLALCALIPAAPAGGRESGRLSESGCEARRAALERALTARKEG